MDAHQLEVGDKFSVDVPVRRPWWAFWRPLWQTERQFFTVKAIVNG